MLTIQKYSILYRDISAIASTVLEMGLEGLDFLSILRIDPESHLKSWKMEEEFGSISFQEEMIPEQIFTIENSFYFGGQMWISSSS
jgi:hypothetical protein